MYTSGREAKAVFAAGSGSRNVCGSPTLDAELPPDYEARARWLLVRGITAACIVGSIMALALSLFALCFALVLPFIIVAIEIFFYIWFCMRLQVLNAQPEHHEPPNHDAMASFQRLLDICQYFGSRLDMRVYLVTWFNGASFESIKRENVAELLTYGFWYRTRAEMEKRGLGHVPMQMVDALEVGGEGEGQGLCGAWQRASIFIVICVPFQRASGMRLPEGYNPGLRSMMHLWEPLRVIYRPLIFYMVMEVLAVMTKAVMLGYGFRMHSVRGFLTWSYGEVDGDGRLQPNPSPGMYAAKTLTRFRVPTWAIRLLTGRIIISDNCSGINSSSGTNQTLCILANGLKYGAAATAAVAAVPTTPLMVLHGVGGGLLPYLNFVRCLLATGNPVMAVEYKHVAMRLVTVIPSADEVAHAVAEAMGRLGAPRACVVSHSYGTFVSSRLAQLHPSTIQSMALIDPVCFGMYMPSLLRNFIYRDPRRDNLRTFLKDSVVSFVSRDMHCAAALCRRFYWSDVNLWPEDLPAKTLVVLHQNDELIHCQEVKDVVQLYATKVLCHPTHGHAEFLLDLPWQHTIVTEIAGMAAAGADITRRLTTVTPAARRFTTINEHAANIGAYRTTMDDSAASSETIAIDPEEELLLELTDLAFFNRSHAASPAQNKNVTRHLSLCRWDSNGSGSSHVSLGSLPRVGWRGRRPVVYAESMGEAGALQSITQDAMPVAAAPPTDVEIDDILALHTARGGCHEPAPTAAAAASALPPPPQPFAAAGDQRDSASPAQAGAGLKPSRGPQRRTLTTFT